MPTAKVGRKKAPAVADRSPGSLPASVYTEQEITNSLIFSTEAINPRPTIPWTIK